MRLHQMPPSTQNGLTYSSRMAWGGDTGEEGRKELNRGISWLKHYIFIK